MQARSETARSGALGLLAGLIGGLCCLGPSVAALLGLGASSALAGLAFGRGLTLAAGGAVLLAGGYLARRRRACALPGQVGWRAPAALLIAFGLSYGLLGYLLPRVAERQADERVAMATVSRLPAAQAGALRRATLSIEKMNCPPCAAHVRGLLARKAFVRAFVAETGNEQVTIDYDEQRAGVQQVIALFPWSFHVALLSDGPRPERLAR